MDAGPLPDQVETDGGCGDNDNDGTGPVLCGSGGGEGVEGEDVETDNGHGCLVVGTLPTKMAPIILLQQQDKVYGTPNESLSVATEQLSRLLVGAKEVKRTVEVGGRSARTSRRGGRGQSSHHKTQPAPSTTTIPNKVQLCATLSYCGILREEFMYSVCLVLALYKPFKPFM